MYEDHIKRVRKELKAAGAGSIGLQTSEREEIARIMHPDEHIGGVIYGRYAGGLAWLVATDHRVIFMDKKPLFTTNDELTYDVVSGVKISKAGPFTSVVLHTRISDYALRYVPAKCARIFVKFIEKRRLESGQYNQATSHYTQVQSEPVNLQKTQNASAEATKFLKEHDTAVLSTVDRTGNVNGATVYYLVGSDSCIYILTKSGTAKGRNVHTHSQVALTVHEPGTLQTVQLQGVAEVETDQAVKAKVFSEIVKPRLYRDKMQLPPVTKLHEGAFVIIRINPTLVSFHDYAKTE